MRVEVLQREEAWATILRVRMDPHRRCASRSSSTFLVTSWLCGLTAARRLLGRENLPVLGWKPKLSEAGRWSRLHGGEPQHPCNGSVLRQRACRGDVPQLSRRRPAGLLVKTLLAAGRRLGTASFSAESGGQLENFRMGADEQAPSGRYARTPSTGRPPPRRTVRMKKNPRQSTLALGGIPNCTLKLKSQK